MAARAFPSALPLAILVVNYDDGDDTDNNSVEIQLILLSQVESLAKFVCLAIGRPLQATIKHDKNDDDGGLLNEATSLLFQFVK